MFLFASFQFKCRSHFRPQCFRHFFSGVIFCEHFDSTACQGALKQSETLKCHGNSLVDELLSPESLLHWKGGWNQPCHLQCWFLLPASLVVCIQGLLLNGATITPVTKCCWSCYCKVTLWQPELLQPCWGRQIWFFPRLNSDWHHGIHSAAVHNSRMSLTYFLISGTEKILIIPEALSRAACYHIIMTQNSYTKVIKEGKNHCTLLKFLTLYIP